VLTDTDWAIIEPFCLGKQTDLGQTTRSAVVCRSGFVAPANGRVAARIACCVRALALGVQTRLALNHCRCILQYVQSFIFRAPDLEYAVINGSIISLHRSGRNATRRPSVRLMPGQLYDLRTDHALDANGLRSALNVQEMPHVIPQKSNRRFTASFDK